jgi:hypothetical protein
LLPRFLRNYWSTSWRCQKVFVLLHVVNLDHTLLLSSNSHFLWNRLGLRWLFLCLFLSICLRLC